MIHCWLSNEAHLLQLKLALQAAAVARSDVTMFAGKAGITLRINFEQQSAGSVVQAFAVPPWRGGKAVPARPKAGLI